jgi:arginine repressor
MNNISKIDTVFFYGSYDEIESYYCKQFLNSQNIKIQLINVALNKDQEKEILEHLKTWKFGITGETISLEKLPLVKWRVTDGEFAYMEYARNCEELKTSNLVLHKDLITSDT